MYKAKDLIGQKFNKLTVIKRVENHVQPSGQQYAQWLCKCECGNETVVRTTFLIKGRTKSCGCLVKEKNSTHGLKKSRLYAVWRDIKARCFNPNAVNFKNYGAKGITICDKWRNDFKAFYDWAMDNGYNPKAKKGECTIDRIDVNGNYEPNNCRWVDNITQQNNKRNNRYLTYNGETHTTAEWGRILNISRFTLFARLKKGWSVEKTLSTPLRGNK